MPLLRIDDLLPLDCTRHGGCCHGHLIPITPWELALLARARGLASAQFRDRHCIAAGTRLLPDGPLDPLQRKGCGMLDEAHGCSVHAARPLACRLYPLGRQLIDGQATYHHPGERPGCHVHCPDASLLPPRRVGDWLAEQGVAAGEGVHDAYGRFACGLLGNAADIARQEHRPEAAEQLRHELRHRAGLPPEARAALLPPSWHDLISVPPLEHLLDDPAAFVLAHAERIVGAAQAGFAGEAAATALLLATCGLQLGDPLGMAAQNAADFVTARLAA